jgi:hypothetical protein
MTETTLEVESVQKLTRDLRKAALTMGPAEIRYLVDGYYSIQEYRKASRNQVRASKDAGEPGEIIGYIADQAETLEKQIKGALDKWSNHQKVGAWMRSHHGIGPVITSGMLAHFDIKKAPTVGHFWSFAGLDPTTKWEKKQKRPWNARLKVLCWKLGDSFVKFHNDEKCFYGKLYSKRKLQEVERNEAGLFSDQAKRTLEEKNIKAKDTLKFYVAGKLPPGRIDLRARRWAVKIFLSHLHHAMYLAHFKKEPPVPFSFTKSGGDHAHYIEPPNLELVK